MAEKLTVLITCKDEERNIGPCIESVRGLSDEVLVADSGSTDRTMEVVRLMPGCRLIQREFVNYADFKNWAIPHASHPWVFILDADERMTTELADEIREVLVDAPEQLDGYFIPRRLFFMGHPIRYSGWQTDKLFRLFRRERGRYGNRRVHAEIEYDPKRAGQLKSKLLHYSYGTYDEYFKKHVRQTKWTAQDLWERGVRTGYWGLAVRPLLRFLHLYFIRLGILDGLAGLQLCMLMAFFNTFVKQARLWEMQHANDQAKWQPPSRIHSARVPPLANRFAKSRRDPKKHRSEAGARRRGAAQP